MATIQDVFADARRQRDNAYAAINTRSAEESVAEGERQNARVSQVLGGMANRRRPVGGGQYGNINSRRNGFRLGDISSGVGAANRKALTSARQAEEDVKYKSSKRAKVMSDFALSEADSDAVLSDAGRRTKEGNRTKVEKIDGAGTFRTSYL